MGISLIIWSQLASDSVTRSLNRCFLLLWDILCAILWTACRKKSVKSSSIRNQAWVNHEDVKWMVSSLMMLVGYFDVGRSNVVKVCVVGHCVSVVTTGKWKRGWWGEDERKSGRWKTLSERLLCFAFWKQISAMMNIHFSVFWLLAQRDFAMGLTWGEACIFPVSGALSSGWLLLCHHAALRRLTFKPERILKQIVHCCLFTSIHRRTRGCWNCAVDTVLMRGIGTIALWLEDSV